jgi:type IV secretory pathway VirB10-like protein
MEQPSSSQLGLVLGLPLVAIVLAVIFAYLMTGGETHDTQPAAAPSPYAASPEPQPIAPAPTKPEPPAQQPPTGGIQPPPGSPPAQRVPDMRAEAEKFQDPKIREHAQLISIETARMAMKQRNLEHLRRLRESLRDQRIANVIPASDLEAMDVGIDCLARASGFRQHADDFLDDHPSSELAASVREVCQ